MKKISCILITLSLFTVNATYGCDDFEGGSAGKKSSSPKTIHLASDQSNSPATPKKVLKNIPSTTKTSKEQSDLRKSLEIFQTILDGLDNSHSQKSVGQEWIRDLKNGRATQPQLLDFKNFLKNFSVNPE